MRRILMAMASPKQRERNETCTDSIWAFKKVNLDFFLDRSYEKFGDNLLGFI